jgi:hypothetical protein
MKCEALSLDESFQGTCFGDAFSKACQYAITNKKFVEILSLFQSSLPSQICKNVELGVKNLGKQQEWNKASSNSNLPL